MTPRQALKIAIACIHEKRHQYAFDARLYERGLDTYSTAIAHKHYTRLIKAEKELQKLLDKSER